MEIYGFKSIIPLFYAFWILPYDINGQQDGELCMVKRLLFKEQDLVGHCSKTCNGMPDLFNVINCDKVSDCTRRYPLQPTGSRKCDWCECSCWTKCSPGEHCAVKNMLGVTYRTDFLEPEINDNSCGGKCHHHEVGPQGSELLYGCQRVYDCIQRRRGWTRGFYRCDQCTCTCETPGTLTSGMDQGKAVGQCARSPGGGF